MSGWDVVQETPVDATPKGGWDVVEHTPAPAESPGLWKRATVNAKEGFDNTSTAEVLNYNKSGQANADRVANLNRAIKEAEEAKSPVGLETYGQSNARAPAEISPHGGVPLDKLREMVAAETAEGASRKAEYEKGRAADKAEADALPPWQNEPTLFGKALAGGAALGGQIVGGLPAPENLIGGAGPKVVRAVGDSALSHLARNVGAGVVENAAAGSVANPMVQEGKVSRGEQDAFSPEEFASSVVIGGGIGGGIRLTGALWSGVRAALAKRAGVHPDAVTPDAVNPDAVKATIEADPGLSELAKANGVTSMDDPRNKILADKLAARRGEEAGRVPSESIPIQQGADAELARRQAERDGLQAGTIDPAATNLQPRTPNEAPIRVDSQGGAFREDPGALAGRAKGEILQRADQRALPAPGNAHLTPEEIDALHADQSKPTPDTLYGQDGRAPQTRDNLADQRQAADAFTLAQAQRERAGPTVADTQPAGRPEGAGQSPVHMDEGHPVDVIGRRMVPDVNGRMTDVATVRRYDPRTGDHVPGGVEYDVPYKQLETKNYAKDPRRAQDFVDRAQEPPAPELPRQPGRGAPEREQAQTYRMTPPDDNVAGTARASRPEQPDGPHPGSPWSTAEEAVRHFQERQARGEAERPAGGNPYEGAKATNKARPVDRDGRFPVDEAGHVMSTGDAPIRFKDQMQAGKWIINVGQKKSPDQIFEIANHPAGGFSVRERGRSEAPEAKTTESTPETATTESPRRLDSPANGDMHTEAAPDIERAINEHGASEKVIDEIAHHYQRADGETPTQTFDRAVDRWTDEMAQPHEEASHADENTAAAEDSGAARQSDGARGEGAAEPGPSTGVDQGSRPHEDGSVLAGEHAAEPGADGRPAAEIPANILDGSRLSSNPFADPKLWAWVSKSPGLFSDKWKAGVADLFDFIRQARGQKSDAVKTSAIGDVARGYFRSMDAEWRTLAKKYQSKTMDDIRTMFHALPDVGRGGAVEQTFSEGVLEHGQGNLNKVADILKPLMGTTGKVLSFTLGRDREKLNQVVKLVENPRNIRPGSPIHDAAAALRKLLDESHAYLKAAGVDIGKVDGYFPHMLKADEIRRNPDLFVSMAAREMMANSAQTGVKNMTEARARAEAWRDHTVLAEAGVKEGNTDFIKLGHMANADFAKERVLIKKSPEFFQRFYHTDPIDSLSTYFSRTAKRAEWAKRFGDKNEVWTALKDKMIAEGNAAAVPQLVDMVAKSAGISPVVVSRATMAFVAGVKTWGGLATMPLAWLSSISETAMPAVRSGRPLGAPAAVARLVQSMAGGLKKEKDLAHDLGLIANGYGDSLLSQRFGLDGAGKTRTWIHNAFFKATLLDGLTHNQNVVAVNAAQTFVRRLGLDVAAKPDGVSLSKKLLTELGVSDHAGFSQWVARQSEGRPTAEDTRDGSAHAQAYRTAIIRFVSQTIMRPNAQTFTRFSQHPVGGLIQQLQSFNYAFTNNVLARLKNLAVESIRPGSGLNGVDRLAAWGPALAMLPMLGIAGAVSEGRDALFTDPKAKPMEDWERALRVVSRGGVTGTLDPWINLVTSARYRSEASSMLAGPVLGKLAHDGIDAMRGMLPQSKDGGLSGPNSPNTNTAERVLARSFYDLVVAPAAMTSTLVLPAVLRTPAIAAMRLGGVRGAAVDAVAGPKAAAPAPKPPSPPRAPRPPAFR